MTRTCKETHRLLLGGKAGIDDASDLLWPLPLTDPCHHPLCVSPQFPAPRQGCGGPGTSRIPSSPVLCLCVPAEGLAVRSVGLVGGSVFREAPPPPCHHHGPLADSVCPGLLFALNMTGRRVRLFRFLLLKKKCKETCWGGEHTAQCTDDVLWNRARGPRIIFSAVSPQSI